MPTASLPTTGIVIPFRPRSEPPSDPGDAPLELALSMVQARYGLPEDFTDHTLRVYRRVKTIIK